METETTTVTETNDETPTVIEDAPDVVVVDTGGSSEGDTELAQTVGRLEAVVEQTREELARIAAEASTAEAVAEHAEEVATEAVAEAEQAEAAVEEEAQETEEYLDEIEPKREHPFFRSLDDWRGR